MTSALVEFLRSSRAFTSSVVVGNPACDLDSVVCSLVQAFFLTFKGAPSVPILPIASEDLPLRTEVTFLLRRLSIPLSLLHFRDSPLSFPDHVTLHLVDHNLYTPGTLPGIHSHTVSSVVDHHVDEGGPGDKMIKMVGSCATLLTEIITSDPSFTIPPDVRTLLVSTILLDTIDLNSEQGRTTPLDLEMFERLALPRGSLYSDLIAAKTDISELTAFDLLRRDSKSFITSSGEIVVVASITGLDWEGFERLPDLSSHIERYLHEYSVGVLVVMLANHSGGQFTRHLVLGHGAHLVKVEELEGPLQLEKIITEWSGGVVYMQGNVKASRKVVLPLMREQLE